MSVIPSYGPTTGTKLFRYFFTPKTPNIATGVPFYLPEPESVLLHAAIEVIQAFDGTTPKADLSFEGTPTVGLFATIATAAVDLTALGARSGNLETKATPIDLYMTTDDPPTSGTDGLVVTANQTGLPAGASSASSTGKAYVYLLVGYPQTLNSVPSPSSPF